MSQKSRAILTDGLWFLFWGALSSFWCISAAERLSATFDEPFYLHEGLQSWRTGSFKTLVDVGTMPLPVWVNTAPLYVWERFQGRPFDVQTELDKLLPVARATALGFWWLLLGYGWAAGRQIAGPWGARLAVLLLACEPTVLAHAALATTDVAVTAGLLAFLFHYRSGRSGGWLMRVGVPALWFGFAVLCKVSALYFGVLGMAVLEVEYRFRGRIDLKGLRGTTRLAFATLIGAPFRRHLSQVFWIGLLLVFVFCGSDWKASPSLVKWAQQLPDDAIGRSVCWFSDHLRIFSNAGNALAYQTRRNFQTQDVFLLGDTYGKAVWYYFPVALSIKMALPLLALPFLLAVLSPRSLRNWLCALSAILLLYSLNCRVQLGVRLLLPLVCSAVIGFAAALVRAVCDAPSGWQRRALIVVTAVVPLWMGGAAWSAWPNGLSYVNELWGGTTEGYKLVSDSNYDWGQGVKELVAWQQRSGTKTIEVIYFGTDPLVQCPPLHPLDMRGWQSFDAEELRAHAHSPYVAVGTTFIYSTLASNAPRYKTLIDWFRQTPPAARTSTFLIYDLRQADGLARTGP